MAGNHLLLPTDLLSQEENITYMAELYQRCQETRTKTHQQLADKYLQPLIKPKAPAKKPATQKHEASA